jgi:hypothetical protein
MFPELLRTLQDSQCPTRRPQSRTQPPGQWSEAQTDSADHYTFSNLAAGDYQVSCSVEGAGQISAAVTAATGAVQNVNLSLTANPAAPPDSIPNAPSSSKKEPSLEDLGFSKSEQQGNARQQALLDKRTHTLKIQQRMGLITTLPMIAPVVTSLNAGGKSEGSAARDLHVALGALTGDLYGITAYYAIRAPKIPGTDDSHNPCRLQNRSAVIAHEAGEERDSNSRRDDVESAVTNETWNREVSESAFLS